MGRRVRKTAESYNGSSWDVDTHRYFVYEPLRWNVLLVLDAADGSDQGTEPDYKILRKYTWGLDMSGQYGNPSESGIHGAGNIGGLLACVETDHESNPDAGQYWFFYDANGNVTQVIYQDGSIKAHYEYDPYGHVINDLSSYTYADANPFRFSTKWLDDEIGGTALGTTITGAVGEEGLYYYGYRYYSPTLGRWMSRDPIEEQGGFNLYAALSNGPVDNLDALGHFRFQDPKKWKLVCTFHQGRFKECLEDWMPYCSPPCSSLCCNNTLEGAMPCTACVVGVGIGCVINAIECRLVFIGTSKPPGGPPDPAPALAPRDPRDGDPIPGPSDIAVAIGEAGKYVVPDCGAGTVGTAISVLPDVVRFSFCTKYRELLMEHGMDETECEMDPECKKYKDACNKARGR